MENGSFLLPIGYYPLQCSNNVWDLVMSLLKPLTEIISTIGLGIGLHGKISVILGKILSESVEAKAYEYPRFGETKERSNICLFHISGQNQEEKNDPMKKLKFRCQKFCKNRENHSKLVCEKHLS